jgi:guanylate kinase
VDPDRFEAMVAERGPARVGALRRHLYGTPPRHRRRRRRAGAVVVLDIEVQGAVQVKQRVPDALLVFLLPPSFEELEARLRGRGTEDDATIARRLEVARREVASSEVFDVRVVNDDLDTCVAEVLDHIAAARRSRPSQGERAVSP